MSTIPGYTKHIPTLAHATEHQDGGVDEVSIAALSGLLADAQTPLAHKTSHQDGGADELSLAALDGEPSTLTTHKAATTGIHSFAKSCRVYHDADQSIPNNTTIALAFNSERWDTDVIHDPTSKTGAASATLANHLVDTGLNQFVAGDVGKRVWNSTDNTFAVITVYNSVSDVTISADIMASGEAYVVSFNSRLTCKTAGIYLVSADIQFATNVTGRRVVYLMKGGATMMAIAYLGANAGGGPTQIIATTIDSLAIGDYFEVKVYQDSGAALNVNTEAQDSPEFMMARIA